VAASWMWVGACQWKHRRAVLHQLCAREGPPSDLASGRLRIKRWPRSKKTGYAVNRTARTEIIMSAEPVVIKRYANRRLYNPAAGSYVTIKDLGALVEDEEDFVVYDANTG